MSEAADFTPRQAVEEPVVDVSRRTAAFPVSAAFKRFETVVKHLEGGKTLRSAQG